MPDAEERENPDAFDIEHIDVELPPEENYTRIEIRPDEGKVFLYRDEEAVLMRGAPMSFEEAERRGYYQGGPNPTEE